MKRILKHRYQIMEKLGKGTTGQVYRVWDIHMEKEWAVKELGEDCRGELHILKTLSHHRFPRIVDAFEEESLNYLVMDYVKGITLEEMLKRGPLPEKLVRNLTGQIIEALLYLHESSPALLYLDLKPSNIIVQEEGQVKLVDVGSVMVKGRTGRISGTLGYASPEQIRLLNGGRLLTEQSDIFSLGMLMFSMVTGSVQRLPIITEGRRHGICVRRYNPLISPAMEQIIEKCTRGDKGRRFLSLRDVQQQLQTMKKRPLLFAPFQKPDWQQEKSILCTQGRASLYIATGSMLLFLLVCCLFPALQSMAGEEKQEVRIGGSGEWKGLAEQEELEIVIQDSERWKGLDEQEELEVVIRDHAGRKVLVREGCAYETEDRLLFEIDWEELESESCKITILCQEEEGEVKSFQMDCLKTAR